MTRDRAYLLAAATRCQQEALAILADEAADAGDPVLEAGCRWLAQERRWPALRHRQEKLSVAYWAVQRHVQSAESYMLPAGAVGDAKLNHLYFHDGIAYCHDGIADALEWAARQVGTWLASIAKGKTQT